MVEPVKEKINMGGVAWTKEEDQLLRDYIKQFGEGKWDRVPLLAGLNRCRKSCRLRWLNYLRPNIKRGSFTEDERQLIIKLHTHVGNRWSLIAGRLPGRTANDVKNYWNCHLSKRLNAQATALEEKTAITPLQPLGIRSNKPSTVDMGPSNNSQPMVEESSFCMPTTFEYVVEVDDHELVKEEESSCVGVEEPAGIVDDCATDHFGQIHELNVLGANHGCGKLDWDALILDMDLWTNSL